MSRYASPVSLRTLFAIVVALAVLFAPTVTREGQAFAAVPDHDMQMMEVGHCQSLPSHSGAPDEETGKSCCISICFAVAITPAVPASGSAVRAVQSVSQPAALHRPYLGELATPPPRSA